MALVPMMRLFGVENWSILHRRLGYLLLGRDNTNSPRIGSSLGDWQNNRDLLSNYAVISSGKSRYRTCGG